MALINNIWVHVIDENVSREIESTDHPTETGIDITDNIKRQPVTLSISGKIVDTDNLKSHEALAKLYSLQINGSLITYSGRNLLKNMQIQSFNSSHPNTNAGGLDFDMELKEVRIASSSYSETSDGSSESVKIKEEEAAGTQQITQGDGNPVYHITKDGNNLYDLMNTTYKELGTSIEWVVENNPDCFENTADISTLKIGVRVLMGYKQKDKTESTQYGVEATWLY